MARAGDGPRPAIYCAKSVNLTTADILQGADIVVVVEDSLKMMSIGRLKSWSVAVFKLRVEAAVEDLDRKRRRGRTLYGLYARTRPASQFFTRLKCIYDVN